MSQVELSESKLPHEILSVQCDRRCDHVPGEEQSPPQQSAILGLFIVNLIAAQ